MKLPFELLGQLDLRLLTLKTVVFLLQFAHRISELQALLIRDPFLQVLSVRVVLRVDPAFLLKLASSLNRSQEIVLPSFVSNPSNDKRNAFR